MRLHVQGYAELTVPVGLMRAQELTGAGRSSHFEPRAGPRNKARAYCMKEDSRVEGPWEYGTYLHSASTTESIYKRCLDTISDGASLNDTMDEFPAMFCRHRSSIAYARALHLRKRARAWRTVDVRVYHGATGTGKSRAAHDERPAAYVLNFGKSANVWWVLSRFARGLPAFILTLGLTFTTASPPSSSTTSKGTSKSRSGTCCSSWTATSAGWRSKVPTPTPSGGRSSSPPTSSLSNGTPTARTGSTPPSVGASPPSSTTTIYLNYPLLQRTPLSRVRLVFLLLLLFTLGAFGA